MVRRHAKSQQPFRTVEPLLVVVDQPVRGIRHQNPRDRHACVPDIRFAGDRAPHARIAPIGGDQKIDLVDRPRLAVLHPRNRRLARIAGVATDIGYRDGISAGQNDLRNHKEYRPDKHDAFKDADHGYRKDYGDKALYKEQYRKGFTRGYEDAFHNQGR